MSISLPKVFAANLQYRGVLCKLMVHFLNLSKYCSMRFSIILLGLLLISCNEDPITPPFSDNISAKTDTVLLSRGEVDKAKRASCALDGLTGTYKYGSDSLDLVHTIRFFKQGINSFSTREFNGMWYPEAAMPGYILSDCRIMLSAYEKVKKPGLPSPGGSSRYYYDSMRGEGKYYPEKDSMVIHVEFKRENYWTQDFAAPIYLKKID